MFDLIESTHLKFFQLYRAQRLKEMGFEDGVDTTDKISISISMFDLYNQKKTELNNSIQQKELKIKESFVKKVKDKENELKEYEKKVIK